MSNALILKRTNVPGRQPEASDLEKNEIAYNNYDGRIYIKKIVDGVESLQEVGGVTSVNGYKFDVALNTDDIPEGETNRYFTEGRVKLSLYPGTGVFYDNATGVISIGQPVGTTDSVTFVDLSVNGDVLTDLHIIDTTESTDKDTGALVVEGGAGIEKNLNVGGNVAIDGNLTVRGITTTVESETLTVADNTVLLNSNVTGAPTENAGIEVERGNNPNVELRWNETNDYWEFTEDGTNYHRINKLYAGTNISHNQSDGLLSVVQGSGSGLDADKLDGYHFSDLDSRFVNVAGDTMTGDLTFTEHAGGIVWTRGSDSASLKFYDINDTDPAGRLEFSISGSGTEYYRWVDASGTELLKLDPAGGANGLTMRGNTVWHAGNDGAGTGLDADLLDGQHGSYYLNYNNLTNKPVQFVETVYDIGSSGSSVTPNWNLGTVQLVRATSNFTLNVPTNMPVGASLTLIITQDTAGNRLMTSNAAYKYAAGVKDLSTTGNAIDMINIFNPGTGYYMAALTLEYA